MSDERAMREKNRGRQRQVSDGRETSSGCDPLPCQRGARVLLVETMPPVLDAQVARRYGLVALGLAAATLLTGLVREAEWDVEIAEPGAKAQGQIRGSARPEAGLALGKARVC